MTTIEIQNKGISFNSPYTHIEAAQTFRLLIENGTITSNFANSLYNGAKRFGKYTQGQIPWVHVLVAQAEGRATKPEAAPTGMLFNTDYTNIHRHLLNARQSRENGGKGLLHPVVGLQVGEQRVVLKLAGSKSRHNGKVSVASDHRYGHGEFYGWIDQEGKFQGKNVPQQVIDILDSLAEDPQTAIASIGKESGHCCYCFAELTTVQSKIAGCGKTCADNYGTPYPTAAQTRQFVAQNPDILDGASDRDRW